MFSYNVSIVTNIYNTKYILHSIAKSKKHYKLLFSIILIFFTQKLFLLTKFSELKIQYL